MHFCSCAPFRKVCVCCGLHFRLSELVEVLAHGGARLVVEGTKVRDNVIKLPSELVSRADKHLSICEYQNMATKTSISKHLINTAFLIFS